MQALSFLIKRWQMPLYNAQLMVSRILRTLALYVSLITRLQITIIWQWLIIWHVALRFVGMEKMWKSSL